MFFLDLGLSYTSSKLFTYILFPLLGLIAWLLLKRRMKRGWLKWTLLSLFIGIPFGAFFLMHPIYEGDFSNNSVAVNGNNELDQIGAPKLVVISIPNCPFCQESIDRMIAFKERHPAVKIEYRVCVNDTLAKEAVKMYKDLSKNKLEIQASSDGEKLAAVAEMSFPTFVLITKNKKMKWSNDNFGVGALDEVVATFEK